MKLGFDVHNLEFFPELTRQPFSHLLPQRILQPGASIGYVTGPVAERTGLPADCEVAAGALLPYRVP